MANGQNGSNTSEDGHCGGLMIIKTFTAPTLDKALWLLNEDLGSAGIILKTRFNRTKNNSHKPLNFVEITAALDSSLYGRENPEGSQLTPSSFNQSIFKFQKSLAPNKTKRDSSPKAEIVEVIGW